MAEILIVDDERMIRAGLARLLSGAGFAVREARDGKSALAAVTERRPDLVLLDIMMPGMDGFEVCEKLLATDRDLPVVFLTAKDSESDQVRGLAVPRLANGEPSAGQQLRQPRTDHPLVIDNQDLCHVGIITY